MTGCARASRSARACPLAARARSGRSNIRQVPASLSSLERPSRNIARHAKSQSAGIFARARPSLNQPGLPASPPQAPQNPIPGPLPLPWDLGTLPYLARRDNRVHSPLRARKTSPSPSDRCNQARPGSSMQESESTTATSPACSLDSKGLPCRSALKSRAALAHATDDAIEVLKRDPKTSPLAARSDKKLVTSSQR